MEPRAGEGYVLGVLLLAAGKSSRMGRPKMLLAWGKSTVLGWQLEVWRGLGARQMGVVIEAGGPLSKNPEPLKGGCVSTIPNARADEGMFGSVRCGASWPGWDRSITHFSIALGDQPHVSAKTLRVLIAFSEANAERVCQPSFQGKPRHPVVMPSGVFRQLVTTPADNLKSFLAGLSPAPRLCEVGDPAVASDLDTPEDYERLKRLYYFGE